MPESLPRAEEASLYVLDLLDPDGRRAFERELESSPELREHVTELQASFEALAVAAPPCTPPPRVWENIASRTADIPARATETVPFWVWLRRFFVSGWAVATALAVAFLWHWNGDRKTASAGASTEWPELGIRGRTPQALASGSRSTSPGSGAGRRTADSGSANSARHPDAENGAVGEPERLRDRVRLLSDQVAMLTHVLTQRAVAPPGAARLQVFRLVGTNVTQELAAVAGPDPKATGTQTPGTTVPTNPEVGAGTSTPAPAPTQATPMLGGGSTTDYTLALALAAARQLAALPTTPAVSEVPASGSIGRSAVPNVSDAASGFAPGLPETTATELVVPSPGVSAGQQAIQIVELGHSADAAPTVTEVPVLAVQTSSESGLVGNAGTAGTAFGAYSLDSGAGAIAFRVPDTIAVADPGVLQLWVSDSSSGLVQSVGYTARSGGNAGSSVMVMTFHFDGAAFSSPTFMITREPVGGSVAPTGPVVAQPPTATPTQPPAP